MDLPRGLFGSRLTGDWPDKITQESPFPAPNKTCTAECVVVSTSNSSGRNVKRGLCCEQVESVATTLSLAEQNHAEELKRVCLEFVSRNLQAVMLSEGYQHMVNSCPQLQVTSLSPNEKICAS